MMDTSKFSTDRLGIAGMVSAVPMMPTAAQCSQQTGMLHLKLFGDGYVRASLPSIVPASYKQVINAIKVQPTEPSWSGTGTPYFTLEVVPDPGGAFCTLMAGLVKVGYVAVIPGAELVSADVPMSEQAKEADGGYEPPTGGPTDPSVN